VATEQTDEGDYQLAVRAAQELTGANKARLVDYLTTSLDDDDEGDDEGDDDISPSFTAQDAARLAALEAEFEAAGGRGVELAEEIDALRRKRSPETFVVEILSDDVKVGEVTITFDGDPIDQDLAEQQNGPEMQVAAAVFESLSLRVGDATITQAKIDDWWA